MTRASIAVILAFPWISSLALAADPPLLLQKPTLSRTQVAFVFGGDIWVADRQGGDARRLTAGTGTETDPIFSPDGTQIAFTGDYDGNRDVYVVPATGGVPRRLTYHPAPDFAVAWTPDGKNILFRTYRNSFARFSNLYTLPAEGGIATPLPLPRGETGSYSADGRRLAYVPYSNGRYNPGLSSYLAWKRYGGGTTSPIWIANLADSKIEKIPRDNSNDFNPMWVGEHIYFLSDRNGPVTLFRYDPATKEVKQLVENHGLDIKSASAGPDGIIYEQFGSLHIYDLGTGVERPLTIRLSGDFPAARPHYVKMAKYIENADLSPSGARAVFESRGEILTVPAEKGDVRNLTNTPGSAERSPAWSPDGHWIAFFSDESGEYQLHLRRQNGMGEVRKFSLGDPPSFYYDPRWSPDNKKIAYTDKRLNVWILDLAAGKSTKVDTNTFDERTLDPTWSPDSRWLAYTKVLKNHLNSVFVYDLEKKARHRLTDGMSDARYPAFDKNGKYLYFTASTDIGPSLGPELAAMNRPVTRSVYVVVLAADLPSPLAHESDEEKEEKEKDAKKGDGGSGAAKDKAKTKAKPAPVRIDLDGIDQRVLALPVPAHDYTGLLAGKAGIIYLLEGPSVPAFGESAPATLHKFDLEKRKLDKLADEVSNVVVSHDGGKLLYKKGEAWIVAPAAEPPKPGEGTLKIQDADLRVDPRAEWKQMYHEVWRIERDFLYDPNAHGLDLKAAERKYRPYLDRLASRADLNYLFEEMLGELTLGHVFVRGGDLREAASVKGGLLGADYDVDGERYRFARIYNGENWNPKLKAPLTQPGTRVREGEYLFAVNGQEVRPPDNLYRFFENTAGKAVVLKVGPKADGKGSREVTVVPVDSEASLRRLAWIEGNRRKVDRMTGGRVAYIYLPDTGEEGYTSFNRYFFAQTDKEAAVLDERYNNGGLIADHVIEYLKRPLTSYATSREGADLTLPMASIFGPKAMIINEMAGSGGDAMPYLFRQAKLGPLVGTRTWGGLVGIGGYPTLLDGGQVTAPHVGLWFPSGKWEVENHGVAPDIEVEEDPHAVRSGHDPQLEKAVQVVMSALEKNPGARPHRPAFPNYHKGEAKAATAISEAHFHHLQLNSVDPAGAIEFYTSKFDCERGKFAGLEDADVEKTRGA